MKLDLYIPGLLAAPSRLVPQLEIPPAPALETFVARARAHEGAPGRYGYLLEQLATQHLPLGALAWLGATGERPSVQTFLATPVHLKAGMNDLVLFSGSALAISEDEHVALADDLAAFFDDAPALRIAGSQLFLQLAHPLDVHTTLLHEAQGETVRDNLPRGDDAGRLHAWMNELQMFLHAHAVNARRTELGLPPLNGIWIWGEGELPALRSLRERVVFAETLPMRGLGMLLGSVHDRDGIETMLPASGHHVIEHAECVNALDADDIDAWRRAVKHVSAEILQPVLDWLARHRDAEAVLHAGDGKARTLRGGKDNPLRRMFRRGFLMNVATE